MVSNEGRTSYGRTIPSWRWNASELLFATLYDVFRSIPLQRSLATSNFDISSLSDGDTILYIIIPADKLKSHYRWLRLVISTALKAVVRKPNQPVAFLIDECANLGYMPELVTAMALFTSYNIQISVVFLQDSCIPVESPSTRHPGVLQQESCIHAPACQ